MNSKNSLNGHIKIPLIKINQKGKDFFVGKINSKEFLYLYTVEPAEYDVYKHTSLSSQFKDDADYLKFITEDVKAHLGTRAFQREENKTRVNEIADFLRKEEYSLFPNSIIVTCDLANDLMNENILLYEEFYQNYSTNNEIMSYSFLEQSNGNFNLYIPRKKNSILVIDGQHRVRGLEESSDDIINNFELLISFILSYDRAMVAKLFYTVNYTQKSVNKSRLYHLMGEFSRELTEISFMHEVVRVLNEFETSPLLNRIKMLGTIPKNIRLEEREQLTISQAFLIDNLVPTISKNYARSIYQPIFLYYYIKKDRQIDIIRFIIRYFTAIKNLQSNDWANPANSIIGRTISIGAFLRIMHFLFVTSFIDEYNMEPESIKEMNVEFFMQKLDGIQEIDFSRSGQFGGAASEGSLNKLKENIIIKAQFTHRTAYQSFIDNYRQNYLPKFKDWITNVW